MFYSYSHHPFESYVVDPTIVPIDKEKGRSHVELKNIGV
jgi:hypothetical protein